MTILAGRDSDIDWGNEMEGLLYLVGGAALLLLLATMAMQHGADSRDGFGGERTTRPRS